MTQDEIAAARALRKEGLSFRGIGEVLEVHANTVRYHILGHREQRREAMRRVPIERKRRYNLRHVARAEAAERGVAPEVVYEQWGVA